MKKYSVSAAYKAGHVLASGNPVYGEFDTFSEVFAMLQNDAENISFAAIYKAGRLTAMMDKSGHVLRAYGRLDAMGRVGR